MESKGGHEMTDVTVDSLRVGRKRDYPTWRFMRGYEGLRVDLILYNGKILRDVLLTKVERWSRRTWHATVQDNGVLRRFWRTSIRGIKRHQT